MAISSCVNSGASRMMSQSSSSGESMTTTSLRNLMHAGNDFSVRCDTEQPNVNCLWISPTGQIVLITGL